MSRASKGHSSWRTGLGRLSQYEAIDLKIDVADRTPASSNLSFAICTPSFNQAQYLDATINSVLSQNHPSLDYWVQDGGSIDNTPAVLEEWAKSGLRYESGEDDGQADAINRGFRHVEGDVMGWLNSDDLLLPGALRTVAATFDAHPEVDVVYGHRILIDGQGRDIGRWIMPKHEDEILRWADYIPQETMFWRRSLWEAVGAELDASFRFALDWDLILRFLDANATFYRIPRFLGAFRIHEEQKTSAQIESLGEQEMARLRTRTKGRPVSDRETWDKTKPYLLRASLYSAVWKLGLADYGPI